MPFTTMRLRRRIAAIGAGVLALGGAGVGSAIAASPSAAAATPSSVVQQSGPADPDNVQQGDQTSPDTGAGAEQENESAGEHETEGVSDGPGGHADASGDVQHEAGASER
ncbi:hypothetical protein [Streptomyces sp. TP-A0356]|uniref:hypothetical protein n=1 Tax=Streptomyces sp. TP-A0356 TaxID=1359208 RepID=UPI0006E1E87C|nr:hypothetical protein [Streptomyces sp. TP-A0356]